MRAVAVEQSWDNPDNRGSERPRRHQLPGHVRARHKVEEKGARAPMVSLADSLGLERPPRLSVARDNRSAERKKERGLHRQDHDNFR